MLKKLIEFCDTIKKEEKKVSNKCHEIYGHCSQCLSISLSSDEEKDCDLGASICNTTQHSVQLLAPTVGVSHLNVELSRWWFLIGIRQRLLQTAV